VDIQMPQLGETVTEGTITRWLKSVGDHVDADEPLFEVSTDKVDSEVPAPASGTLSEILVQEGETAEVGTRLAVISDGAGAAAAATTSAAPPEPAPPAQAAAPPQPAAPATPPPSREPVPPSRPAPSAPAPSAPAPSAPAPSAPAPSTPTPPPTRERVAPPAATTSATPPPASTGGQLMSPVVRRLLNEYGLDASEVQGSGEGGRITRNDVLAAAAARQGPSAPAAPSAPAPTAPSRVVSPPPRATPPAAAAPVTPVPAAREEAAAPAARQAGDETVPFDNIRRRTAEHMVRSKATSPHVYTSIEVDYERVDRARRGEQEDWRIREGFPLTYLPFIVRAFCDTVEEYPHVNASVDGENLVVHHDVHVGIAVDLDFKGLIAPVIRDADGKRLRLIAREIHDLATRARSKQLMPDEIAGGTFTITNPGPWGTYMTLPIINQPQVAILSTDGIRKRPWVVTGPDGEDSLAIRHVGILALTWDHRAFDGGYAAAFLQAMKDEIQGRDWEAELA
jgi:pyruvate dehydrogenase E2 component (dihydrolipoamide acetyltransferase)